MRTATRSLGVALLAGVLLLSSSCVSFDGGGHTANERGLLELAGEIRGLARSASSKSDARVERLRAKAAAIWAASPSNTKSAAPGPGSSGYEYGIVLYALVDYFQSTGRAGKAIPVLEAAAAETKRLRYYTAWQDIALRLVELYQRVGMIDHARRRVEEQLDFLARLGFTEASPPTAINRDAVVFVSLHATRLAIDPTAYTDSHWLRALFDLFRVSVDEAPEAWGWTPGDGYRFVTLAVPFAHRFATLGDLEATLHVRHETAELHRRNRSLDPFALANQKGLDSYQSQLGRDLHKLLNRPFAAALSPLTETVAALPPVDRRYLARDPFVEDFEKAQISTVLGQFEEALAAADQAIESHRYLVSFYESLPARYATSDNIQFDRRWLDLTRAGILEYLGRFAEAEVPYEDYVDWSERERESLPLELRMHFFRGQARNAYQGSIRCSVESAVATQSDEAIDRILEKTERLRSRQFREQLGADDAETRVDLASLRAKLGQGEGILELIDLRRQLVTLLVTRDGAKLQRLTKARDWDGRIFGLRNRLAEAREYDAAAFTALGEELLGFAAHELDGLERLYVLTDGALSALPASILSYRAGHMLHESACLTLVPSLSLWLASKSGSEAADTRRALILGDPAFDKQRVLAERLDPGLLALRGAASLGYFERLPETADEARSVASTFPLGGSQLLLGEEALESRIKQRADLASFSHLHFATHGVIGSELPGLDEPALVLGWEEAEDGYLTASEVAALELDARLTVLSACNTGNGEYYDGEGLIGMGRAFLLAGSDRVVVSLWPVESLSTRRLMELFYERLARGEVADLALWNAQRDLRALDVSEVLGNRGLTVSGSAASGPARMENPFFWSPFVMISAR